MQPSRCLIVTNDFPPKQGGIETFVYQLARRFPADQVIVYTSAHPQAAAFDAAQPFPVFRDSSRVLLPTARVARRAAELAQAYRCDRAWFGAAAPLGLIAPRLRRAGVRQLVATTHGHEVWWARLPGTRQLLRRIAAGVDVLTHLGDYTGDRLAAAVGSRAPLVRLVPGVDTTTFYPGLDGDRVSRRHGLAGRRVILTAARLVSRKGQDALIRALPAVRRAVPEAALLLVGDGPREARLRRLAHRLGVADQVIFAGGRPHEEMPWYYGVAEVFAMPCRTRLFGLEPEGLGIVFLEAAACGLPVIVGDSGGAVDAVLDGQTGYLVDGRAPAEVARLLITLLTDVAQAERLGKQGRGWVQEQWTWDASYARLTQLLSGSPIAAG